MDMFICIYYLDGKVYHLPLKELSLCRSDEKYYASNKEVDFKEYHRLKQLISASAGILE